MADQKGQWVTIRGTHVFIKDGESAEDALNRTIAEKNEKTKQEQIAKNQEVSDKLNGKSSEPGKVINGKFYTLKELKNMSLEEMRKIMGGQIGGGKSDKPTTDSSKTYSFSANKSLSDTEKGWLEQAIDWANGEDNMPMVGMNTISQYYGVKFGKSAGIIKEIHDDGNMVFNSMNKTLINQAMDSLEKLKQAIKKKEGLK